MVTPINIRAQRHDIARIVLLPGGPRRVVHVVELLDEAYHEQEPSP